MENFIRGGLIDDTLLFCVFMNFSCCRSGTISGQKSVTGCASFDSLRADDRTREETPLTVSAEPPRWPLPRGRPLTSFPAPTRAPWACPVAWPVLLWPFSRRNRSSFRLQILLGSVSSCLPWFSYAFEVPWCSGVVCLSSGLEIGMNLNIVSPNLWLGFVYTMRNTNHVAMEDDNNHWGRNSGHVKTESEDNIQQKYKSLF